MAGRRPSGWTLIVAAAILIAAAAAFWVLSDRAADHAQDVELPSVDLPEAPSVDPTPGPT